MAELAERRSVGLSNPGAWIGHVLDGERLFGFVLVAPAIIYIVLLVGYPFAIALWFTVSNATTAHPIAEFTGLTNLLAVWDDDIFRRALANTFIFTLTSPAPTGGYAGARSSSRSSRPSSTSLCSSRSSSRSPT